MSVLPNVSRVCLEIITEGWFPTKTEWYSEDWYNRGFGDYPLNELGKGLPICRWDRDHSAGEAYAALHESSIYDPETDLYTLRLYTKYADGLVCFEDGEVGVSLFDRGACRIRLMADAIRTIEHRFRKFLYAELIFNIIEGGFDITDVFAINGVRLNSPLSVDGIFSKIETHDQPTWVTLRDKVIVISPKGEIIMKLDSAALKKQTTLLNSAKKS